MKLTFIFLFVLVSFIHAMTDLNITIGSFNVQIFGKSKMEKPGVPEILTKIFRRYDVALIQEIRDSSNTYVYLLLDMINNCTNCPQYNLTLSERLGRTTSKEQYGFFYKRDKLEIINTDQFNVTLDYFERPNYSVEFKLKEIANESFFLSANHISPSKAPEEIDLLVEVYDSLIKKFQQKKILFLGDFNAGCTYVANKDWANIRLRNQTNRFRWYIGDNANTNLGATPCPYDRFVGNFEFDKIHLNGSENIFNFDIAFNMTLDEAKIVSDHFPIEMKVQYKIQSPSSSPNPKISPKISPKMSPKSSPKTSPKKSKVSSQNSPTIPKISTVSSGYLVKSSILLIILCFFFIN
jgi:endonuclease/exonuclease/phosphatase family metal-dependent hydrolase